MKSPNTEPQALPDSHDGFLSESQLLSLVPIGSRTLKTWRDRGLIPFVRIPGGRRILYRWPSVRDALSRMEVR